MNKKGFTLMELLVVVIIIAGLVAVVYPGYRSSIERARASEAVNMIAAIQATQQKHYINYEEYGTKFKDINDFKPSMQEGEGHFVSDSETFSTEYFKYTLDEYEENGETLECVRAERIGANGSVITLEKGYFLMGCYRDSFLRCYVSNHSEEGDKVCSSLTDREQTENDPVTGTSMRAFYPIY